MKKEKSISFRLQLLGISELELREENDIKKQLKILQRAFYAKAKTFHPDINKEMNGEEMKMLSNAYEELKESIRQGIFCSDIDTIFIDIVNNKNKEREIDEAIETFSQERPNEDKPKSRVSKLRDRYNVAVDKVNDIYFKRKKGTSNHDDYDER